MAREAAAIWNLPLRLPEAADVPAGPGSDLPAGAGGDSDVRLEDADLCPRYCAQVFEITIGPSPQWLADRLKPPASARSATSSTSPTT